MSDVQFIDSGDEYFDKLWELIDNSKTYCWILTYHMAKSFIADETLRKLKKAAERGVDVVVYVDWLNYHLDNELVDDLKRAGGRVEALNDMNIFTRRFRNFGVFTKNIFKRYHEKICLIDDSVVIGSANFDLEYGEYKYGNNTFYDLNMIVKKSCIKDSQQLFLEIADRFGYQLTPHEVEEFSDQGLEVLHCEPNYFRHDIQEELLYKIHNAKERIIMAQGYYYNIKKVVSALKKAAERGVKIELYTTRNRDQMVYKDLVNVKITKKIRAFGARVREMTDRILHTKAYIIDDELIAGSFNNDKWSWSMNSEMCLACNNPAVTARAMKIMDQIKNNTQVVQKKFSKMVAGTFSGFWKMFLSMSEFMMNGKKNYKDFLLQSYIYDQQNPIEERFALRMRRVEKYSLNTSTLSLMICS